MSSRVKFKDFEKNVPGVSLTVALLIRLLEYSREEVKTDEELHELVERMSAHGNKMLSMEDYDDLVNGE